MPTDASTAGGRGDRGVVDGGTGPVNRRTAALLCAAVGVGFVALVLLAGVIWTLSKRTGTRDATAARAD